MKTMVITIVSTEILEFIASVRKRRDFISATFNRRYFELNMAQSGTKQEAKIHYFLYTYMPSL